MCCPILQPVYSLRTFTGHSTNVTSLDFHPNKDDLICSCDGNGEIRYWSIPNGSCTRVFKVYNSGTIYLFNSTKKFYIAECYFFWSSSFHWVDDSNLSYLFRVERTIWGFNLAMEGIWLLLQRVWFPYLMWKPRPADKNYRLVTSFSLPSLISPC